MTTDAAMSHKNVHDENVLDLKAALRALRRRKWVVVNAAILGACLTSLFGLAVTPLYTATATIVVEPRELRVFDDLETSVLNHDRYEAFVENQVKLLGARENLARVIDDLDLHLDPDLRLQPPLFDPARIGSAKDRLLAVLGIAGTASARSEAPAAVDGRRPRPGALHGEALFDELSRGLRIVRSSGTGVISVSFTAADPGTAARVANAVAQAHIGAQVEEKVAEIRRTGDWLAERIALLRSEVREAERAVEEYRAVNRLDDGETQSLSAAEMARLRVDLNEAQADRIVKEERLRHVNALRAKGDGYKPFIDFAGSPVIVNLLQRDEELMREEAQLTTTLGDRHPLVVKARVERRQLAEKMDQEVLNVVRNLEGEVAVARARERALEGFLAEARDRSSEAGRAGVELRELEREAASRRSVYETALLRFTELQEKTKLSEADAKVISAAVPPPHPQFPKLGAMVTAGVIVALVLGTAVAALLEHLDGGLRTSRQVEDALGLTALGLVPKVRGMRRHRRPYQYLLDNPGSPYAEAVRSVFMRAHLAGGQAPPRVVLVTSTLPGEGKTTLAMSLGASVARSGHATIVVDLDLRHPSVARELGRPVEAGLLEFLSGDRTLDQVILSDGQEPRLHLLPVRGGMSSPADLLASPMMKALMTELRRRYRYVVLDAPPALGFTDATIAAQLADAVLFVVQWEKTDDRVAASGLEAVLGSQVPVIGAAVTQVDVRKHARYGYGDVGTAYGKHAAYAVK
jgi:succinoglycan biosynthesis transport protein ExoP